MGAFEFENNAEITARCCGCNNNNNQSEACIIAQKIFDQCRIQKCLSPDILGPARSVCGGMNGCNDMMCDGDIIIPPVNAATVTMHNPELSRIDILRKCPNTFREGCWDLELRYVFDYTLEFRRADGCPIGCTDATSSYTLKVTLFGSTESAGKEFLLNHAPYRVVGVVKDVSTLADSSYGQVWIPFTSTDLPNDTWSDQHMGMMSVTILARCHDDFGEIRAEAKRRMSEYNSILADQGYTLIDRNRPYDQETQSISFAANLEPDLKSARRERAIIFIILLLVPAINLSSMTQSRLRQRVAEIGVRRAFGSTRMEMVGQIIMENLGVTLLAGAVGLFISIVMAYLGTDILFAQPYSATLNAPTVDSSILLHPSTFLYALLFCFVLNLLSSGIPAWRASRTSIVNALGGRIH